MKRSCPSPPVAERNLRLTLAGAVVLGAAVLVLTWISGGLALAARETPVWLGLSLTLGVAAIAIGLVSLGSRSDAEGNANDTFVLRRHYASRVDMLWYATISSAALFAFAMAAGVVPPILASNAPVPAAAITFDAGQRVVTAMTEVRTHGLATDEPVTIQIRQYSSESAVGVLIGHVTTTGDASGESIVREAVALDRGARYMSVMATIGDDVVTSCSPLEAGGPGCTVVSVPPLGAGIVRLVPAVPAVAATEPTATISPAPTIGPSASPTTSI